MKNILTLIALLGITLFASCEHKGFCDPDPAVSRVHVVFDWRKALGSTASTMSLYLYPEDGGEMLRYDFSNAVGGVVEIPPGKYRVLCVNNDTETVLLRGTDKYDTFEAYTRPSYLLEPLGMLVDPTSANPTGEAVVLQADRLWIGRELSVEILPATFGSTAPHDQEITLYPEAESCSYTVEIRNVTNLQYVSALCFSLSGLSGNLLAADGTRSPERSMIPFDARADVPAFLITGGFHGFGLSTSENTKRTLTLYAILSSGAKQYYTFDVSAQVNGAANPKNVHIVIDGLSLPKPIVEGSGGFTPQVDDWVGENIEMDM